MVWWPMDKGMIHRSDGSKPGFEGKTLFVFPRTGAANRDLLRTELVQILKQVPSLRIVIVSPLGKEPYFREEFSSERVLVEPMPKSRVGFWARRFRNFKLYLWSSRELTSTIRVFRRSRFGRWRVLLWQDPIASLLRLAGITEKEISDWEIRFFRCPEVSRLYDQYRPDAILFSKFFSTDIGMVKEAKKRNIKTICLVQGWDTLTSKGYFSVIPDFLIVWNEVMKRDAIEFHGYPAEKIMPVGIPQFDHYWDVSRLMSRDEFFGLHRLDPRKKLITFATASGGIAPEESEIIELFYQAMQKGRLGYPGQLLIRIHPNTSGGFLEALEALQGKPGIVMQRAGRTARIQDKWDPSREDMDLLALTMYHSDVVINAASTITLDAIAFDTPVIGVAFNLREQKNSYASYRHYYDFTHFNRIVKCGGLRLAYSLDELIHSVNQYLKDPSLDSEGRRRIREDHFYSMDGQSARRAAQAVVREMGLNMDNKFLFC